MWVKLILSRYNLKASKYVEATIYGLAYFILFFLAIFVSQIFLNRVTLEKDLIYASIIGIVFFIVYLIKYELFYNKT